MFVLINQKWEKIIEKNNKNKNKVAFCALLASFNQEMNIHKWFYLVFELLSE